MFRSSVTRIGKFLLSVAAPGDASSASTVRPQSTAGAAERRLAASRKQSPSILAGSIQLIGMDEIRRSLGDNWATVAGKAQTVAKRIIAQHLSADDVFEVRENDTFVVCFARPDKADAERRAHRIVDEIKAALAREVPEAAPLRVDHVVAELEWADIDDEEGSLTDMLARSLRKVQQEANEGMKAWRRALVREAYVLYRPIWSAARRDNPIYHCLVDEVTGKRTLERLASLSNADHVRDGLADLDGVVLSRAVEGLHQAVQSGSRAELLVPVNFMTLTDEVRREQYLRLCRDLPDTYRRFIFFEIHSAPSGQPRERMVELVRELKGAGAGVAIGGVTFERHDIAQLARGGAFAISVSAGPVSLSRREIVARYADFAMLAKSGGLKAIVHGAGTVGLVQAAKEAGIDFVDGNAISFPSDRPTVGPRPSVSRAA